MKIRGTLIAALIIMAGCGKEIPEEIIQPDKMENVLYDYHLAMGMSNSLKTPEKEAYKNFVFEKHHVTKAEFDSSMVWYTREAQELAAIYENLDKRFKREHVHAETLLENREGESVRITSPGDTVNIWNKAEILWMTRSPLSNPVTFEFKADSNFHAKDAFRWNMNVHFFSKGKMALGLNVVYDNDSIVGETRHITQSGKYSIYLKNDSAYKIKGMNGFIHVMEDSVLNPNILIHDISLVRYHRLSTDSVSMVAPYVPEEMTDMDAPEEEMVQSEEPERKEPVKPQAAENKKRPRNERLQKADNRE